MSKRVPFCYGAEQEFGFAPPNRFGYAPEALARRFIKALEIESEERGIPVREFMQFFGWWGGRAYLDNRVHLEITTGECMNLRDAVRFDLAIAGVVHTVHQVVMDDIYTKFAVYRTSVNTEKHPLGYHENYIIPLPIDPESVSDELIEDKSSPLNGFMFSSTCYTGVGRFHVSQGGQEPEYSISERALLLDQFGGLKTAGGSVPFKFKEGRSTGRYEIVLENRFAEPNQSEFQTYLRIGTRAIMTRLAVLGMLERMQGIDPTKNLFSAISDPSLKTRLTMENGKTIGIVDYQRKFLKVAKRAYEAGMDLGLSPEECDVVLSLFELTLDGLERDPMKLDYLDWVIKYRYLREFAERYEGKQHKATPLNELLKRDFAYHNVDPDHCWYVKLRDKGVIPAWFSDEERAATLQTCPRGPAQLRLDSLRRNDGVDGASWQMINLVHNGGVKHIPMATHRDDSPAQFQEFLTKMIGQPTTRLPV
jgi:hypothetical protein